MNKKEYIPDPEIHELQKFVKTLKNVSGLKDQLSFQECKKLISEHGDDLVIEKLGAMENCKELKKKYNSVYLTCHNWCKIAKDKKEEYQKTEDQPVKIRWNKK